MEFAFDENKSNSNNIRWKQRFENFERAFRLLQEAFEKAPAQMSDLEKEGVVQRFEYTFELAWKTLKDYLVYSGVVFDQITPRNVIKQAFAAIRHAPLRRHIDEVGKTLYQRQAAH
jgi:hypothetical protein